jgi:hypothetical protein
MSLYQVLEVGLESNAISTKDHVVSPLMFHKTPSPGTPHFRDEHAGSDGMFSAGMTRILHWDDRKYLDSSDSNL